MNLQLLLGGSGQDKREYGISLAGCPAEQAVDSKNFDLDCLLEAPVIDEFHQIIRRLMIQKMDPFATAEAIASRQDDVVIICDEVGCGIVPADPFERQYRETVGRICCALAQRADKVIRMECGIPICIKGV